MASDKAILRLFNQIEDEVLKLKVMYGMQLVGPSDPEMLHHLERIKTSIKDIEKLLAISRKM